jgi:hypothetical protein
VSEQEASSLADKYNRELGVHLPLDGKGGSSASVVPWAPGAPWQLGLRGVF